MASTPQLHYQLHLKNWPGIPQLIYIHCHSLADGPELFSAYIFLALLERYRAANIANPIQACWTEFLVWEPLIQRVWETREGSAEDSGTRRRMFDWQSRLCAGLVQEEAELPAPIREVDQAIRNGEVPPLPTPEWEERLARLSDLWAPSARDKGTEAADGDWQRAQTPTVYRGIPIVPPQQYLFFDPVMPKQMGYGSMSTDGYENSIPAVFPTNAQPYSMLLSDDQMQFTAVPYMANGPSHSTTAGYQVPSVSQGYGNRNSKSTAGGAPPPQQDPRLSASYPPRQQCQQISGAGSQYQSLLSGS